ncbi:MULTISPECIES: hypothetical protein [Fischerella]|uniref:hypothetical protein n=1 Tax=Fischerella sp. FACHB-380 TaxID=2692799 RepID=UPI0002FE008E|nr:MULTISPECIES: hypothetical protein [Fischerella]MBD2433982.1 hypothetical protein [Fischerella sp. FACHB-380]
MLIAANLQTLSEKYHQTFAEFNPTQNISQAIERLQKLQLSDRPLTLTFDEKSQNPVFIVI